MNRRISDLRFDLRHPWWTFTREVALMHCQRTGQKLVPVQSPPTYNITVGNRSLSVGELQRRAYQDASAAIEYLGRY